MEFVKQTGWVFLQLLSWCGPRASRSMFVMKLVLYFVCDLLCSSVLNLIKVVDLFLDVRVPDWARIYQDGPLKFCKLMVLLTFSWSCDTLSKDREPCCVWSVTFL